MISFDRQKRINSNIQDTFILTPCETRFFSKWRAKRMCMLFFSVWFRRCQMTLITTPRLVLHSWQESTSSSISNATLPAKGVSSVRASALIRIATCLSTAICRVHARTVFATIRLTFISEKSKRWTDRYFEQTSNNGMWSDARDVPRSDIRPWQKKTKECLF